MYDDLASQTCPAAAVRRRTTRSCCCCCATKSAAAVTVSGGTTAMAAITICPLCLEPLDPTECNLYPCCFCKFQICLFCLNRLKEESGIETVENEKRVCGSCPGCRNPYPADSDDESMAIAIRMTKKRTKGSTERSVKGNRNANSKPETRTAVMTTAVAENTDNRSPGNRSRDSLTQAERLPHDHHKQKETVNHQSEKSGEHRTRDRWRGSSDSHSFRKERFRGPAHRVPVSCEPVRLPHRSAGSTTNNNNNKQSKHKKRHVTASCDPNRAPDQKQDATSIREKLTEEKKQELVSLLSSLGLSPCNIRFHPQRQES